MCEKGCCSLTLQVLITVGDFTDSQMWSVEYVQVPEEKEASSVASKSSEAVFSSESKAEATASASQSIQVRKMSRHESCDSYASEERSAVDLLKDFKDPDYLAARECELGSSGEQDSPLTQRMKSQEAQGQGTQWDERVSTEYHSGEVSATSSLSDLCTPGDPGADWENVSMKSGTASVDTGMDALAVLGEGSEGELDQGRQLSSLSEPCLSGVLSQGPIPGIQSGSQVKGDQAAAASAETDICNKDKSATASSTVESSGNTPVVSLLGHKLAEELMTKHRPFSKNILREG